MFQDRAEAGRRLLAALPVLEGEVVVLALPRGGVPVAEPIATALGAPLDVVLVRKVGVPGHGELALAAVTNGDDPVLTVNEDVARHAGLDRDAIWELAQTQLAEIARRRESWFGGREALPVRGKTVIVVDDGIATGATMRASLQAMRLREPARIVLAVPVAPMDTLREMQGLADTVVCLETPTPFYAVGAHYRDFAQVPDTEVAAALARSGGR
ncbi:MAG: phosphoribosyltransferase [Paracoccaceae bacterium]|nr:phosphoribosyltransferase [Paracoccaceae bacterium]